MSALGEAAESLSLGHCLYICIPDAMDSMLGLLRKVPHTASMSGAPTACYGACLLLKTMPMTNATAVLLAEHFPNHGWHSGSTGRLVHHLHCVDADRS